MKRVMLFLLVALLAAPAFGITPIGRGPAYDSRFWNWPGGAGIRWMGDIEELVEAGTNLGTGNIFYVDSNVTTEGNGTTWTTAKDTLDEAVGLCTADNGDIIFVAQGHSESLGTGTDVVDIDVAGVTVIGLGTGKLRPLFDYTDYDTGSFAIGADDVTLCNVQFCANVTDVNEAIEVEAGAEQVTIQNCLFYANSEGTDEFHECIEQSGAAADRLTVTGCHFAMGAGGARSGIAFIDSDYAAIVGNVMVGDYAIADVNNATTASNHILIADNVLVNATIGGNAGLNAQPGIELLATTTGVIRDNDIVCNLATMAASIVAADCYCFRNYYNEDEGGGATGGAIGTASADDS